MLAHNCQNIELVAVDCGGAAECAAVCDRPSEGCPTLGIVSSHVFASLKMNVE